MLSPTWEFAKQFHLSKRSSFPFTLVFVQICFVLHRFRSDFFFGNDFVAAGTTAANYDQLTFDPPAVAVGVVLRQPQRIKIQFHQLMLLFFFSVALFAVGKCHNN